MEKDVSIIIVNYKTKDLTIDCLKSIYEKTNDLNFDVFVIDNNSQDGSVEAIRSAFPQINLIENSKNSGFGSANNIGIRQSDAKYVFLLNSDTILVNNAVKILFDFMQENPDIGACGGNLYSKDMKNMHSYGTFLTLKRQILKTFFLKLFFPKERKAINDKGRNEENLKKQVEFITGADLMIRKEALDKTGLFDERIFMYSEESELQFRITKAGYKIFINPEAKIIHLHDQSPKSDTMYFEFLKSKYLMLKFCYGTEKNLALIKLLILLSNWHKIIKHKKSIIKLFDFILNDKPEKKNV